MEKRSGTISDAISAYFEEWEKRLWFLPELVQTGHEKEAVLLCCCYIEGFGNRRYLNKYDSASKRTFVEILREYSGDERFMEVYPKELELHFNEKGKAYREQIPEKLSRMENIPYTEEAFLVRVAPLLTKTELPKVQERLWQGTVAALIYRSIRCNLVHMGEGNVHFYGFGFEEMYAAILRICEAMKEISLSTEQFFGNTINEHLSGELLPKVEDE